MNFTIDLNTVLTGLTVLGIGGVFKVGWDIKTHLATLNGSVATLKQWQYDHDKADDTFHRQAGKRLDRLEAHKERG